MRLTAADRCDRCGAQAYVRLDNGLLFCAHHAATLPETVTIETDERQALATQEG